MNGEGKDMTVNHKSLFLGSAAIALAFGLASPAFAQENAAQPSSAGTEPAADENGSGEIIVTAQKRSESVRDVPMSMTALSGDALKSLGVNRTEDLAKVIPGFSFAQSFTNTPIYTLRGVGLNETTLAAGPTVSVYVDEVPLPFSAMTRGATLDLQRLEVLKGPQGTLYGQNSTGGAINYIAAKPTDQLEAGGSLSFSRFATADAQAYVSGPLSDTLSGRIAVQTTQGGDWQTNQARPGETLGQTDFLQGRMLLQWEPSSRVRFLLNANGWRDHSDAQAPQLVAKVLQFPGNALPGLIAAEPNADAGNRVAAWDPGVDYRNDDNFYQFALKGEIDLTDAITLTSISAYSHYEQDETRDIDGTAFQVLLLGSQGEVRSLSQELRLTGDSGPVKWIIGGNYAHDKATEFQTFDIRDQTNNLIFGIPNTAGALQASQKVRTLAAFANADVSITDKLVLQGGIRYTDSKRDFTGCSLDDGAGNLAAILGVVQSIGKSVFGLPPGPAPVAGGCINLNENYDPVLFTYRLHENNVSWRAGFKYNLTPRAMFYANVSRGYKSGLFPTVLASSTAQYVPVKQEKLTAYEAGVKFTTPDRKFDISAAAFYYDYRDKQVRSRILDPIFVVLEALANAPKSDVKGAEVQITARPVPGLTLNLAGSYLDAKIKEFVGINQLAQVEDFSGTRVPFTSKWQAVGDAEYRWSLDDDHEAFVGGTLSYTSSANAFLGEDPVGTLNARTLLDLRAGISGQNDRWQFSVWGRNVTNKNYQNYIVRITDTVIGYAGRPATFGATLAVKFD